MGKQNCVGLVGFIFGHRFKDVITRSAPVFGIEFRGTEKNMLELVNRHRSEIYHGSVCTRCGAKVDK